VLSSLLIFIGELPDKHQRIPGLLLSLAFEAIGVVALFVWRRRPTVALGVVVSALGVLPVLVFTFIDPNRPNIAFGSFSRGKGTLTGILVLAAAAWLAAYLLSPGRRAALYLGVALLAVWLVLLLQLATSALERYTGEATTFSPFEPSMGPGFNSGGRSGFSSAVSNTSTRAGAVSLVVGLIYLFLARRLDRKGGTRAATPFFAVAAVALTVAVLTLVEPWKTEGAAILGIVLGAVGIWLGTTASRRFTAWYGGFAVFTGTLALLAKVSHHNNKVAGVLVLLAGIGIAFLANWLTDRGEPSAIQPATAPPPTPRAPVAATISPPPGQPVYPVPGPCGAPAGSSPQPSEAPPPGSSWSPPPSPSGASPWAAPSPSPAPVTSTPDDVTRPHWSEPSDRRET